MKLTAAQRFLLSESDRELRGLERTGKGGQYINKMLHLDMIDIGDVETAAILGHVGAREYMGGVGSKLPTWQDTTNIADHIIGTDEEALNVNAALSDLCSQAFIKVRALTRKEMPNLPSAEGHVSVEDGLQTFHTAINHLRHPDRQHSDKIYNELEGIFRYYEGDVNNWLKWGDPFTDYHGSREYEEGGDYDLDTLLKSAPPDEERPQLSRRTALAHVFDPKKAREDDRQIPNMPDYTAWLKIATPMALLAQVLCSLWHLNYNQYDNAIEPYRVGTALKGLVPLLGINIVQKRLLKTLLPDWV